MKEVVFKHDQALAVNIPQGIVKQLQLEEGTEVIIEVKEGQIVIQKVAENKKDITDWSQDFIEKNQKFYEELKEQ